MNAAGYVIGAMGVALLLSPARNGLLLLLGSGLRVGVWVAVWWIMVVIAVNILNCYVPANINGSLTQFINLLLVMFSWLIAYPLCLLLRLAIRVDEGLTQTIISMTGASGGPQISDSCARLIWPIINQEETNGQAQDLQRLVQVQGGS
jgi:hypothetical protein